MSSQGSIVEEFVWLPSWIPAAPNGRKRYAALISASVMPVSPPAPKPRLLLWRMPWDWLSERILWLR